jgi:hypothetical protein
MFLSRRKNAALVMLISVVFALLAGCSALKASSTSVDQTPKSVAESVPPSEATVPTQVAVPELSLSSPLDVEAYLKSAGGDASGLAKCNAKIPVNFKYATNLTFQQLKEVNQATNSEQSVKEMKLAVLEEYDPQALTTVCATFDTNTSPGYQFDVLIFIGDKIMDLGSL